jgi:hypothetical protein
LAKAALITSALIISFALVLVAWCGWRVTTAMNHGALIFRPAMCFDARHLAFKNDDLVPQKLVDHVLTSQITQHYRRYKKRILPDSIVMLTNQIGWQIFWSADSRRRMYATIERRMRPCPGAMKCYLERKKMLRQSHTVAIPL